MLSWLLRPPDHPSTAQEANLTRDVDRTKELESEPEVLFPIEAEAVLPALEGCRTLDEIRTLIQRHSINLPYVPAFCEVILDHLLESPNWAIEIPALLTAPEFHPAGSSLHLKFVSKLQHLDLTINTWNKLRSSFIQATTLGLISPEDLRAIFSTAGDMKLPLPKTTFGRSHEGNLFHGLVMAIIRCPILHLSDLGTPCLQNLIIILGKSASFSKALFYLGPWANHENAYVFIRVVLMRLKEMPRTENLKDGTTYDLADDLGKLDTTFLLQVLPQVSMHLLGNHPDGPTNVHVGKLTIGKIFRFKKVTKLLVNWRLTLSYLSTMMSTMTIKGDPFTGVLETAPEHQYSHLLTTAWTYISMCPDYRASRSLLVRTGFREVFTGVSKSTSNSITNDRLGRLVVEIYQLAIPNKSFLLLNLAPFIFNRSKLLAYRPQHKATLQALINRDYSMLTSSKLFRVSRLNYSYELVDLAESINPHLSLFKVLSRKWIHHEAKASMVIKRLLKHNHYLKLALSRLGPEGAPFRVGWLYMKTHQLHAPGMPTPLEALDFINHVAASIATTTMWTPRTRFAKLYWLYLYLHKWRAPITKEFTQALWYVCMEYRNTQGPSYTLMRWVLRQVSLAEGKDTAMRLQVSEGARRQRHKAFADSVMHQDESIVSHVGFDEINRIDDVYWARSRKPKTQPSLPSLHPDADDADDADDEFPPSPPYDQPPSGDDVMAMVRSGKFEEIQKEMWDDL